MSEVTERKPTDVYDLVRLLDQFVGDNRDSHDVIARWLVTVVA